MGVFGNIALVGTKQAYRLGAFPDVMHAQYIGTVHQGYHVDRGRAVKGFVRMYAEFFPYHGLSGDAGKNGASYFPEHAERGEQTVILVDGFCKTETWIYYDIVHTELV